MGNSSIEPGCIYEVHTTLKIPALVMLQNLPGNFGGCNATIARELQTRKRKRRPCLALDKEESGFLWNKRALLVRVCSFATFAGTPFKELPDLYQRIIAPVNEESADSLYQPVRTIPEYHHQSSMSWILCVPYYVPLAQFRRRITKNKGAIAVMIDDENKDSILTNFMTAQQRLFDDSVFSDEGYLKYHYLTQLLVKINFMSDTKLHLLTWTHRNGKSFTPSTTR
jgi:hypothetical protein